MTGPYSGDDLVRQIKDNLDIADVIGSYIELVPRGSSLLALCPFHAEKTPSFSVNRSGQFFHCFGCKKSGDIFEFVMGMEGVSFVEALKILGDRCGIRTDRISGRNRKAETDRKSRLYKALEAAAKRYESHLKGAEGAEARKYLKGRGIPQEIVSRFRLGYSLSGWSDLKKALSNTGFSEEELLEAGLLKRSEKGGTYDLFRNRLMLPILDLQGRVLGFGGRVLDDSMPKYINSPESRLFHKSRLFYGLHFARRALSEERRVVVVEGYTDVLMAHCRGVHEVVATLGTALTDDHARMLKRMVDKVILFFDGDEAGRIAAGRGVEVILSHDLDVTVLTLEGGQDPFDFFLRSSDRDFRTLLKNRGEDFFDFTFRHYSRLYDTASTSGKAKLARSLLKVVACQPDLLKKDLLLKKIADTVGISEEVLRKEYLNIAGGRSQGGFARGSKDGNQARKSSIPTVEDDLILGLVREPMLAAEFRQDLRILEFEDEEARGIIEAILVLSEDERLEVRELTTALRNRPGAMQRVIALASDPRRVDSCALVASAIDSLKKKQVRQEYERIRERRRALLKSNEGKNADQLLLEIDKKLRLQKGIKERAEKE